MPGGRQQQDKPLSQQGVVLRHYDSHATLDSGYGLPSLSAHSALIATAVALASAPRYPLGSFGLRITTERQ